MVGISKRNKSHLPSTLGSPQSLRPSSIIGAIVTEQKGLTDIYIICAALPAAQGGTLLPAKNRCLPFDMFTYIHLQMENKKENKNKTNNDNHSKQQVVETFCGYLQKSYQNQTANANKRKKQVKKYRQETHRQKYVETFCAGPHKNKSKHLHCKRLRKK